MAIAARERFRRVLVYFGLAEDPAAPGEPEATGREWFAAVVVAPILTALVIDKWGLVLGVVVGAMFLLALAVGYGSGPMAAVNDRRPDLGDELFTAPVMLASALLLMRAEASPWIPILAAAIVTTGLIALSRRRRRQAPPTTRA